MQPTYPERLRAIERYAAALAPYAGPLLEQISQIARALADARCTAIPLSPEDEDDDLAL